MVNHIFWRVGRPTMNRCQGQRLNKLSLKQRHTYSRLRIHLFHPVWLLRSAPERSENDENEIVIRMKGVNKCDQLILIEQEEMNFIVNKDIGSKNNKGD